MKKRRTNATANVAAKVKANSSKKRRIRNWIARIICGVLALTVLHLVLPESDSLSQKQNSALETYRKAYYPWKKAVDKHLTEALNDSLSGKVTAQTDELNKLLQELTNVRHGEAEPALQELMARSGMSFGSEEEVKRHNDDSTAIQQKLTNLHNRAKEINQAIHQRTKELRELIDGSQLADFERRSDTYLKQGDELLDRLGRWGDKNEGTKPTVFGVMGKAAGTIREPNKYGKELQLFSNSIKERCVDLKCLLHPDAQVKQQRMQTLAKFDNAGDELLDGFPTGDDYQLAYYDESLKPITVLTYQDADLSIAAEGDLGITLVAPLVRAWLEASHYSFSESQAENGIRLTVHDGKQDAPRKIHIINVTHTDATAKKGLINEGANLIFYSSRMRLENLQEKLCSDAMVFLPVQGKEKLGLDEIEVAPKYLFATETPNGIAADLHAMRTKETQEITSAEDLLNQPLQKMIVGSYHNLSELVPPSEMVHIRYPGEHAFAPTLTNIATGQYWYVYDINLHPSANEIGWERKQFTDFLLGDAAKSIIKNRNFVPLGLNELPEIVQLDETNDFPVQEVLARIEASDFRSKMHYGSNRELVKTLRGCQLPYPIFFPTGQADGMQLNSHRTKVVLDEEIHKHIQRLSQRYTWLVVVISGHADIRPFSSMSNEQLSQERANKFMNNIVLPAAESLLEPNDQGKRVLGPFVPKKGLQKPITTPGYLYVNRDSNILVTTLGCGTHYALASELKDSDNLSQDEVDEHYSRDRRASIFVIVPGIDADAVRERPGQDSAPE